MGFDFRNFAAVNPIVTNRRRPMLPGRVLALIGLLLVATATSAQTLSFPSVPYTFALGERSSLMSDTVVGTVTATGGSGTFSYALTSNPEAEGKFSVATDTGVVSYIGRIREDVTLTASYALSVSAFDGSATVDTAVTVNIGICDRTKQIGVGIASNSSSTCENVTVTNLEALTGLQLSSQTITSLVIGDFAGLSGLKSQLVLNNNQLSDLPEGVFAGLTSLISLALHANQLSALPVGVFDGLSSLEELYLYNNSLSDLLAGVFAGLTTLTTLRLENNSLSDLPLDVFAGLTSLTTLNLSGNSATFTVTFELEQLEDDAGSSVFRVRSDFAGPAVAVTYQISGGSGASVSGIVQVPAGTTISSSFTVPAASGHTTVSVTARTVGANFKGFTTAPGLALTINHPPVFATTAYSFTLAENQSGTPSAHLLGSVMATDAENDAVTYAFTTTSTLFSLGATSGAVSYIGSGEDFESAPNSYALNVIAASGALTASATVTVTIADVQEAPVFVGTPYTFGLVENQSGTDTAVIIGSVMATDPENDAVTYAFTTISTRFSLGATSGVLSYIDSGEVFGSLESTPSYTLNVIAASGALTASATVTVTVTEVPDTAPVFATTAYSFTLAENQSGTPSAHLLGSVMATDAENDAVTYAFTTTSTLFSLGATSGAVSYIGSGEDFESAPNSYALNVIAASGALTASATVTVTIADVQEAPVFVGTPYTFGLVENQSGTDTAVIIGSVMATDPENDAVTYAFTTISTRFSLGATSGVLSYIDSGEVFGSLESTPSYTLNVIAASGALTASATVTVTVTEVPDTAPVFATTAYSFTLAENQSGTPSAHLLGSVMATDAENDAVTYAFTTTSTLFSLGATSGAVSYIGSGEDFESAPNSYALNVIAASGALTASATVTVTIADVPEAPVFVGTPYTFGLVENQSGTDTAVIIGSVMATDPENDAVTYAFTTISTRFSLGATSGVLSYIDSGEVFGSLESTPSYTLNVIAASGALTASATVTVTVTEVPDTAPVFATTAYSFTLAENQSGTPSAHLLGSVMATDAENDAVTYAFTTTSTLFSLGATSGAVSYIGSGEDFESAPNSYALNVIAASGALTASATVTVTIADVQEAPVFVGTPYTFGLVENQSGTDTAVIIGSVMATDPENDAVTYAFTTISTRFSLGATSGVLSYIDSGEVFGSLESTPSYTLNVIAASGALTASATVTVTVTEVPDTAPVFATTAYSFTLAENQSGTPSAHLLGSVMATDAENDAVTYAFTTTSTLFSLGATSGAVSYIGSGEDFESAPNSYALNVIAASGALTASATVTVTIADVPEAPVFVGTPYTFGLVENQSGTDTAVIIGSVMATDPENDAVTYAFTTISTRFSLGATSGVLSYIDSGEVFGSLESTPSYTLNVIAASGALTASATVTVTVTEVPDTAPVFATTAYSFTLAENQSGTPSAHLLGSVMATDAENDAVTYAFTTTSTLFSLGATSGAVSYIGSGEDFESAPNSYALNVIAASGALTASATVTVTIADVPEAPVFVGTPYTFGLVENQSGTDTAVIIGSVMATDPENDAVTYAFTTISTRFSLGATSGVLSYIDSGEVFGSLESTPSYTLNVIAASGALTASATVTVTVTEVPDTAPVFATTAYSFTLAENQSGTPSAHLLGSVMATDAENDAVTYAFTTTSTLFSLGATSGAVSYIGSGEDFESAPNSYALNVIAASGALTASATVTVTIADVPEAPVFVGTPYTFGLVENQSGTDTAVIIGSVMATDPENDAVTYAFTTISTRFSLGATSGVLSYIDSGEVFGSLESTPSYTLNVIAASGALTASATVTVTVTEVPDTAPVFATTAYSFTLAENQSGTPSAHLLGSVMATDAENDAVTYAFTTTSTLFSLGATSGAVSYIGSGEDFESAPNSYALNVIAASGALTASATVTVTIADVQEAPVFVGTPYTFGLVENQSGTDTAVIIGSVMATDPENDAVTYAFTTISTRFSLGATSGVLSYIDSGEVFGSLESTPSYTLNVIAASGALTASATVTVTVTEVPDTAPVFATTAYSFTLAENQSGTPSAHLLGSVMATDAENDAVTYAFTTTSTLFSLGATSGAVSYIGSGEDFESAPNSYALNVIAASGALTASATVTVTIADVQEAPVFVGTPYTFGLVENQSGTDTAVIIGSVMATDPENDAVTYAFTTISTRFSLGATSGVLSYIDSGEVFGSLESTPSYTLNVIAASGALTASATVTVTVTEVPDTAPVFATTAYSFTLAENQSGTPSAHLLGSVMATDAENDAVTYAFTTTSTLFSLGATSGAVSYIGSGEDFESAPNSYALNVIAASGALTASATVTVTIADVQEAPVFVGTPYTFGLVENQSGTDTAVIIGSVMATDPENDAVTYAFTTISTRFSLGATSGVLSYIDSGEVFGSLESTPSYTLNVIAASGALTASATVTVTVTEVPDTAPVFATTAYSFTLAENQSGTPSAHLLGSVMATDAENDAVTYAFTTTSTLFSLGATSGAVSYIGSGEDFESAPNSYALNVIAASGALTASATVTVTIADVPEAPVFVGTPYTFGLVENQSGTDTAVIIGSVMATDPENDAVTYAFTTISTRFSLGATSGVLSYIDSGEVFGSLESTPSYTLNVIAASGALTASATVTVTVTEVPDTAPVFATTAYSFTLAENQSGTPSAHLLGSVMATDAENDAVTYAFTTTSTLFSLGATSGAVSYIGSGEDFESAPNSYALNVIAASGALTASATVTVTIADVQEAPVFVGTPYTFGLVENQSGTDTAVIIGSVMATDPENDAVTYAFTTISTRFSLGATSGVLSYIDSGEVFGSLESTPSYTLNVIAASGALTASATVTVTVTEVPDTAPVFATTAYSFTLAENQSGTPSAHLLGSVMATDAENDAVTYAFTTTSTLFSLGATSGAVSYIGSGEDFESAPNSYALNVIAASGALTASATVTVTIADVPEAPVFVGTPYTFGLVENQSGTDTAVIIGSVMATDPENDAVTYAFTTISTRFSLGATSGVLSYIDSGEVFGSLESTPSYTLNVIAASGALTASATVTVTVTEVPDTAPVFATTAYSFTLAENQSGTPSAHLLGSVMATDAENDAVTYAFTTISTRFSLGATSGAVSYIGSGEDFESAPNSYALNVIAASGALTASATVTVTIADVPEAPVFVGTPYTFGLVENQSGTDTAVIIGSVMATDPENDAVTYAFTTISTRFSLGATSGVLSYIDSGEVFGSLESTPSYTLNVIAASGALTASATVTVTVTEVPDTAPVFATTAYSFTLAENQSGTPSAHLLGSVMATDAENDAVTYAFTTTSTLFSLGATSGAVSYIGSGEDFESAPNSYALNVIAASGALTASATVTVTIADVQEAPVFVGTPYTFGLVENQSGTDTAVIIGSVMATDPENDAVTYAFTTISTRFSLGATSGVLSYIDSGEVFGSLESTPSYTLNVIAASGALTASATVTVTVTEVPDTAPVFATTAYSFTLAENQSGTPSAHLLGSVMATDAENDAVTYAFTTTSTLFSLGATSGAVSYIGSGEDFESAPNSYALNVIAASGALTASATVTVTIADVQEAPVFVGTPYTFGLVENQSGTDTAVIIGSVMATDPENDAVTYAFTTISTRFSLGATSGVLSYIDSGEVFGSLESTPSYTLNVIAASGALTASATVTVTVTEVPDTAPVFATTAYSFTLAENQSGTPSAHLLGSVMATDAENDAVTYAFTTTSTLFSLGATSGAVSYIGSGEDFESAPNSYALNVIAASGALTASATVTVTIADVQEAPVFVGTPYTFGLVENQSGTDTAVIIGSVMATDPENDAVTYAFTTISTRFSLGATSGVLSYIDSGEVFGSLESTPSYTLNVIAASGALTASATVTVTVTEVPDTAPVFATTAYSFTLAENQSGTPSAHLLGSVMATDAENDAVTYAFTTTSTLFSLGATSGAVSYIGSGEDFESAPNSYALNVIAASGALTASATVTVTIADVQEAPVFVGTPYTFGLVENQSGTDTAVIIGSVMATDPENDAVTYAFTTISTRFSLGATSGVLSYIDSGEVFGSLESTPSYTLNVIAASGALTASATVTVTVTEVPDTAPVFATTAYSFTLAENQSGTPSAHLLGSVMATDAENDAVTYAFTTTSTLFSLGATSGAVSYIGSGEDFESAPNSYALNVIAASGALTASATVTVTVTDVADTDTAPAFATVAYSFTLVENQSGTPSAQLLGSVMATDADGDAVTYAFGTVTTLFSLDATSGQVSYIGSGEVFGSAPSYTLAVIAASGALTASATVTVTVTEVPDAAPMFVGAPYTFELAENQSGTDAAVIIGSVRATDAENDTVTYTFGTATTLFSLDATSGQVSYIGSGEDFESAPNSYTLNVIAASGALTTNAQVTVTVTDVDETVVVQRRTQMTSMVLAQVSRNIAIDTVDVLGGRFAAAPHVTISERSLNAPQWSGLTRWVQGDYWQGVGAWNGVEREINWGDIDLGAQWKQFEDRLLSGTSFLVSLGAAEGEDSIGLEGWSLWGQGRVSGYRHIDGDMKVSGRVLSGYLGVDYQASEQLLFGVAVSHSRSDGYSEMEADSSNRIDIDTQMAGVYPYLQWSSGSGFEFWGTIGRGEGEVEVKESDQDLIVADLELMAVGLGFSQRLVTVGNTEIAVKADGFLVQMRSEGVAALNATDSKSHRLRAALAGNRRWSLGGNAGIFGGVELGARLDGGDGVGGRGLDIGANIGYANPDMGLEAHSRVRFLVAHSEEYSDWGLDVTVRLQPSGWLGRGLSLSVAPGWGQSATAIDSLWKGGVSALKPAAGAGRGFIPDRTRFSLRYGLHYRGALWSPFAEAGMDRESLSALKLGLRMDLSRLRVEAFGNQDQTIGIEGGFSF